MTRSTAISLGMRLLQCPGFTWVRGMVTTSGSVVVRHDETGLWVWSRDAGAYKVGTFLEIPDLRRAGTRGGVLWLVRRLHKCDALALLAIDESIPTRWYWEDGGLDAPQLEHGFCGLPFGYETEALALVVAMEAASAA